MRTHRTAGHRARPLSILAAILAGAALVAACSSTPSATHAAVPDGLPSAPAAHQDTAFSGNGPYRPGVALETTPAGDAVVVTYPVDPAATAGKQTYTVNLIRWFLGSPGAAIPPNLPQNLPTTLATDAYAGVPAASHGPFPVVLFSHGFGGYPEQSTFLTDHLATWGFVVVAPDHRSRDLRAVVTNAVVQGSQDVQDLRDALAMVTRMDHTSGTLLSGKLDLTRVGALGHSAGGGAALTFAGDAAVRTYVALAPAPGSIPPAGKPGMVVQGSTDTVVPLSGTRALYGRLHPPKVLVVVDDVGHNVFDDVCTIGAAQGGLVKFIGTLGLPAQFQAIATDGCSPPDISPPQAWPLIDHAVTAELRWGLGIDARPVGLDSGLDGAFAPIRAVVTSLGGVRASANSVSAGST